MRSVRSRVDRDHGLARRRLGRVHLALVLKAPRHLHAEIADERRAGPRRPVVHKDVVAAGPEPWRGPDELPDSVKGGLPG